MEGSPPPSGLSGGLRRALASRAGRFSVSVAFGIVIVSILAAAMAWRAAVWNERSANTDELTRQDVVREQQARSSHFQTVAKDLRLLAQFDEHAMLGAALTKAAKQSGGSPQGRALAVEGAQERDRAGALLETFQVSRPGMRDDPEFRTGVDAYDPAAALRALTAEDPQLASLRPRELRAEAKAAHIKAVRLTGLAALFIAALVFLTLSEVVGSGVSRFLAGAGVATAVVAGSLYLFAV